MDIEVLNIELELRYPFNLLAWEIDIISDYEWFKIFYHDIIYHLKTILKVDFISGFYVMDDLWVLTDIHANKKCIIILKMNCNFFVFRIEWEKIFRIVLM